MKKRFLPFLLMMTAMWSPAAAAVSDSDMAGYLFVYFTGNDPRDEAICYALSRDGLNFHALNDNAPIIDSKLISETGGVRDPHILRSEDGEEFYMVATDMTCCKGWDSNRGLTLLKSSDLVNWTPSVINIQKRYKGNDDLKRVWAPQTIYDKDAGKYMVYFSMKHGDGPDIIYYVYANDDFTDFIGTPKPLFIPENKLSCIDGDIVYKDGEYHLFYKTEGHGNGIKKATTKKLTSGKWTESPDYKQQTRNDVEGAGTYKKIGEDKYVLMYDCYRNGAYQFTESADLDNFKVIDSEVSMDFHPRHGSVIPITDEEYGRLELAFPSAGVKIKNPVLPEFHADPEILLSGKTGKYYIYSTTDGFPGWGGTYFTCYSSDNLRDWNYEGVALDASTESIPWAEGNLWAPAIEEKVIDGKHKYFLYFSAKPKEGSAKQIGVAVADSPTGPFKADSVAFLTKSPVGRGQQIDVDVFTDPVSGKPYLYWGNGYMAGAELNPDMRSIKEETITVMTPEGGSKKDYLYREGPYVFWNDGVYYFLWSVDDTGSPNYHVAYGTSDSPLGPIRVAERPVLMIQKSRAGMIGTAHNSVLRVPGKNGEADRWYIVYHRINPDYVKAGPGYHREVCISPLKFNADGTLMEVNPSPVN
ncbi:MAG: family 43 glycosylhydrolase [Muribaculaceae bacterium]|nr:family 43 glycosylhydrolase [Muribaculaceae bacterium]